MQVTIDPNSGFCFGVVHAIETAERELRKNPLLYCLGDIVHNNMEVDRLKQMGLVIISHEDLNALSNCKVLIRAHGEPPETYKIASQNNIELIDASCPIVLTLQNSIHRGYMEMLEKNGQIVIYGKEGHAEVNALKGQTDGTAIVVGSEKELSLIDFSRPVRLYGQTTKSVDGLRNIAAIIKERMNAVSIDHPVDFEWNDSICRQVANRSEQLKEFASHYDVVVFVTGMKSSNGMALYEICRNVNPRTKLVSALTDVKQEWFDQVQTVGICGATSTPMWLMREVATGIQKFGN